jgi:Domain of unknown function (DUF4157)
VRVHTGRGPAEVARAAGARALAAGADLVFGAGEYAPGTGAGRALLAHELAHAAAAPAAGDAPVWRALTAPPSRMETTTERPVQYRDDPEATLDRRIADRQAEPLQGGTGMRLGTVDYPGLPAPAPAGPAPADGPPPDPERRAVKTALLEVIAFEPSTWADTEFRVSVPLSDAPTNRDYALVVLRFDASRNAEAVFAGKEFQERGEHAHPTTVLPELEAQFGITFVTSGITATLPGQKAPVQFTGKAWSSNDAELLRQALPLLGASEKAIIKGTKFRRINAAVHGDVPGFYSSGDDSVNLMDAALPFEKEMWFGEGGKSYTRGVHTVVHEVGHALHYAAAPAAPATAPAKNLQAPASAQMEAAFKAAVLQEASTRAGTKVKDALPPQGITLPTAYSQKSWKEFFAETYAIYRHTPSFLSGNPQHRYLYDFFVRYFP